VFIAFGEIVSTHVEESNVFGNLKLSYSIRRFFVNSYSQKLHGNPPNFVGIYQTPQVVEVCNAYFSYYKI